MLSRFFKEVLCCPEKDDLLPMPYESMDGLLGMHGMHCMHYMDCMHDLDSMLDMRQVYNNR